jgi:hypothetical protein
MVYSTTPVDVMLMGNKTIGARLAGCLYGESGLMAADEQRSRTLKTIKLNSNTLEVTAAFPVTAEHRLDYSFDLLLIAWKDSVARTFRFLSVDSFPIPLSTIGVYSRRRAPV